MTKATNESTPKTASITRRTAVAGVSRRTVIAAVAVAPIATLPVVALPGEPDHAPIDLWARCRRLWEVWGEANIEFDEFEYKKSEENAPIRGIIGVE